MTLAREACENFTKTTPIFGDHTHLIYQFYHKILFISSGTDDIQDCCRLLAICIIAIDIKFDFFNITTVYSLFCDCGLTSVRSFAVYLCSRLNAIVLATGSQKA